MKLSEMNTTQLMDALCNITPSVESIVKDKEVLAIMRSGYAAEEGMSEDAKNQELTAFGMTKMLKIIPILLDKHRGSVCTIIAALNGVTLAEVENQNGIKTFKQLKDVLLDQELMDFFSDLMN